MTTMISKLPELICITGVDGSGKSSLTEWLIEYLTSEGRNVTSTWSRFNNYLSKPLLAVTRLTGHNHKPNIDGVKYGFHDFEGLYIFRELFALLQAIDTNIATYFKITRKKKNVDCLICERSPWDTMVDVIADTGKDEFVYKYLSDLYVSQVKNNSLTLFIDRDYDKIIATRPELQHDYKMEKKISSYREIANKENWCVIDNNSSIENARNQIIDILKKYQS
jgi:thymidylate kinase